MVSLSKLVLLVPLLLLLACKEPTKPIQLPVDLSIESVAVTDVRLRLAIDGGNIPHSYRLSRDGQLQLEDSFSGADTILADRNLLPNTSYTYRAYSLHKGNVIDSSDIVMVTTMDTTSHEFVWEVDKVGVFPSVLKSVFAISLNYVLVGGRIYFPDSASTTGYSEAHNTLRWNGTTWSEVDIEYGGVGEGILAFSQSDIWITTGIPYHWNGTEWTKYHLWDMGVLDLDDGGVTCIWGPSSSDLYFAGRGGTIVHYDGAIWEEMDSGTDAELKDITGSVDSKTGQVRVWVAGILILLHYDGTAWQTVWDEDNPLFPDNHINPTALYAPDQENLYITAWNGLDTRLYTINQLNPSEYKLLTTHQLFVRSMDGSSSEDIFMAGNYNEIAHYNGFSTLVYTEFTSDGMFFGLDQLDDYVFIVGVTPGQQGIVVRGRRAE